MEAEFRDDLDIFCSVLLRRGGWGNHASAPRRVLGRIAAKAFAREEEIYSEEAAYYVALRLEKAGWTPECTTRIQEDVRDILYTIAVYLEDEEQGYGQEVLDHNRTLDLHPATNLMSDPRWENAPRHLVFETPFGKTEAWVCATDEELQDREICPDHPPDVLFPFFHREGGPALVIWGRTGEILDELWFDKGRNHRIDGPAHIAPDLYRRWYIDGYRLFDEEGPNQDHTYREHPILVRHTTEGEWKIGLAGADGLCFWTVTPEKLEAKIESIHYRIDQHLKHGGPL